jgi:hypothetical protein
MRPDTIPSDLSRIVTQRFVTRDLDRSRDRIQRLLKSLLRIRFAGGNSRSIQFVDECIRAVSAHNDLVGMQAQIIRAVLEDVARSKKDEGKNDRDHHVVMQAAAWMSPQNVALDGLTEIQEKLPRLYLV